MKYSPSAIFLSAEHILGLRKRIILWSVISVMSIVARKSHLWTPRIQPDLSGPLGTRFKAGVES